MAQHDLKVVQRGGEQDVPGARVGLLSNRAGLPTVLLEAMALGTPCISTSVTGIPELVRDGETGLIADQASPQSLADTIERLLNDQDLSLRLTANARRLIEAEFDIHRNTAAVRAIFDSVHPVEPPVPLEVR
ncbi:MAG: glycosyltransferase [Planctomycetes bacterium]|nr:glycosyltransferase [Planctomycetota bacterium]